METSTGPQPGTSSTSTAFPVGSRPLPMVPAGSTNLSFTGEAVPGTPAMAKSPSYSTWPSFVCTSAAMILSVLVL